MKFWDASAIVPLCLDERQTSTLEEIIRADEAIVVWWGTFVECQSAFARLRREGILTRVEENQARKVLAQLEGIWTEIAPGHEVRENASRALSLHPLRAADSLQLAAALVWVAGSPTGFEFVCLDARLRDAAEGEGFTILPEGNLQNP